MNQNALDDEDVVSMNPSENFAKTSTSKVVEIKSAYVNDWLNKYNSNWGYDGIMCQVLSVSGGGWRKGKIRLRMEFIPDEPEPAPSSSDAVLSS